ncbi:MAG: hypothetical protein GX786_09840, partial [Clostridiales bacterium]|nr:hypothetical protein [Clostridiales bacterium]
SKTVVFIQALQQKAEKSAQIISLMTDRLTIEAKGEEFPECDIDGDLGPSLPLEIRVLEKHLQFFTP